MSTSVSAARPPQAARLPKVIGLAAVLVVAAGFVLKYVFHYYLNYNPSGFDYLWPRRGWLLLHISGGMVALLIGPWQFSRRLRQRYLSLHRVLGRTYLISIVCGAVAALYLAVTTPFGWAWGTALVALAMAWLTTSGMAFYAVKQRQIQVHQEWMVRSYVVTFAFVTFRVLNDFGPTSHLQPAGDRAVTFVWVAWAVPLLFTEVVLQLRRMKLQAHARR
ncbi:MAG TPA: DUF2306 domain-containing protein [Terracidiphilus sp.]|nr:DUF2306 domain-containing protein [Terracidiphilus sp.]